MNAISRVAVPAPRLGTIAPQIATTREAGSIGELRSDGWSIVARKVLHGRHYEWRWNGSLATADQRRAFDAACNVGNIITGQHTAPEGGSTLYAILARREARK